MPNEVVKRISVKDQNGTVVPYDVGGDAQNIDYNNSNVKAKLDGLGTAATKNAGVANGVATLGGDGLIPTSQLPASIQSVRQGYRNPEDGLFYEEDTYETLIVGVTSVVYIDLSTNTTQRQNGTTFIQIGGSGGEGSVVEGYYDAEDTEEFYENYNSGTGVFSDLITGAADTIYIDLLADSTYRYDETDEEYIQIGGGGSSDLELGTSHTNAYYGDQGDTAYQHSQLTSGNPHHVTAADLDIAVFKCYSKTLDVSEESSVTFTDEDFDEDTVVFGIYTNNGLFYSTIVEDTENHTITITYDTTGISDDFKVIIVFIPGSQIIDMDNSDVEPEP